MVPRGPAPQSTPTSLATEVTDSHSWQRTQGGRHICNPTPSKKPFQDRSHQLLWPCVSPISGATVPQMPMLQTHPCLRAISHSKRGCTPSTRAKLSLHVPGLSGPAPTTSQALTPHRPLSAGERRCQSLTVSLPSLSQNHSPTSNAQATGLSSVTAQWVALIKLKGHVQPVPRGTLSHSFPNGRERPGGPSLLWPPNTLAALTAL
jgi:hypothetical protein